ncbi:MAG: LON peptidase substrate-binding domain-containing protein [Hyphomicrobiaceae bacterium]|nr:LON peptidase substrate-binding domain-containing protein [Hyphomicrobiaceae bacterium]
MPLFPLRGAILLPRVTLPLNVFEPRYLQMIDDVLAGSRMLAIVQPEHDSEPLGGALAGSRDSPGGKSASLHRVACAGRVTAFQELDDGRMLVTLTGISRFAIAGEVETGKAYRIGRCDYRPFSHDLVSGLGESDVDREALLSALKAYLTANNLSTDWGAIAKSSTEFLVNALSVMSPYGAAEKQALLEAGSLKERAEVLVALAEMDLATNGNPGAMMQ